MEMIHFANAVKTATAGGACSVYLDFINLDFNQIGVKDSGEQVRSNPGGTSSTN